MKIQRGSGRIVVFFGSFVLKFCRIQSLLNIGKDLWAVIRSRQWDFSNVAIGMRWRYFIRDIKQNLSEYRCWKSTKAQFLVPTYFTFGFVNIQRLEVGEQLTPQEVASLLLKLGWEVWMDSQRVDTHCWNPENFLKNESGYHIVDYGDASDNELTFPGFIAKWQKELTTSCTHQK